MFANWYAELNLFCLATFPPVSVRTCQNLIQQKDGWYGRSTLLPWWPLQQTWACPYVSVCSSMWAWFSTCVSPSTCVTWVIHMCDMSHAYVRHDSLSRMTWLIHMQEMTHTLLSHDSFTCETRFTHMWDMTLLETCNMTHSQARNDSYIVEPSLIDMCGMSHWYVWHDLFTCETWLINTCTMTCSHARNDSHTFLSHTNVSFWCMGWLWSVGSIKS